MAETHLRLLKQILKNQIHIMNVLYFECKSPSQKEYMDLEVEKSKELLKMRIICKHCGKKEINHERHNFACIGSKPKTFFELK